MSILKHLDKDNLHHAYLIEGARSEIIPEIFKFLNIIDVSTVGNPDFINISIDNFKIDEALELRAMSSNKSFSLGKKIFIICANTLSLDAEGVLLKMFEEPIENTHFFLVVPDAKPLVKTLVSRFYFIPTQSDLVEDIKVANKFIHMSLGNRLDFIKELLTEPEEEDVEGNQMVVLDSSRSQALKFLNALESALHVELSGNVSSLKVFSHFFKVRQFLRMPGSSTKSLLESVALITPVL
ncbi:MAG: hypothetical protein WCT44_01840 [Candidatus Paceibacterota bacterium]